MLLAKSVLSGLLSAALCTVTLAADDPVPTASASDSAAEAALLSSKATYEQTITTLEQRQGAYSPELGEAYFGLGTTLQALAQHEEALDALGKSLQAMRYSHGLQDMKQLPVLKAMLVSNKALEKWEDVDAQLQLVYYITARQLEAGNDTRHAAMVELGRWKLDAAQRGLLPPREQPVTKAIALYRSEIEHMKSDTNAIPGKNLQLATLYLDLAGAELMEARRTFEEPLRNYDSGGQPASSPQIQCEMVRDASGRQVRVCGAVEVPNNNYYVGKTNTKNMVISMHTNVMRDAVKQALTVLRQDQINTPQHKELLAKTDSLIVDYNSFMSMMAATIDPRVGSRTTR